ncbi:galactose/glucose ABC transporter substrate-binding protein MglB [Vallitaleaceae bacterium 9-2]
MRKLLSMILVLVMVLSLAACSSDEAADDTTTNDDTSTNQEASGSDETEQDSSEMKEITIGANIYNFADNFMNGVVSPALKEHAGAAGITINIVDSENQQNKLNDQVDIFIGQGVDILAINLVDPASAGTIIQKAKDADIPLILFNKEATEEGIMDTYDKVWYVGTASKDAGIIQGEMMVSDWQANPEWDKNGDGTVQYVLLKGEPGHPDAEARTEYSVKAFDEAGIAVEELAMQPDPKWSTDGGYDKMTTWLASYGDSIELVICNNDGMAFGAINAMKEQGVEIPVYGVDALAQALNHVADDEMNGTVLNDGNNQAKAVIDLAANIANGKDPIADTEWTLDEVKAVRVPYVAVTKDNYQDFQ